MQIKFEKKVAPTPKQFKELAMFLQEPKYGWGNYSDGEPIDLNHHQYYDEIKKGAFGTYTYRVNLSYQLITVKEVK